MAFEKRLLGFQLFRYSSQIYICRACMDENGMRFDEESVEELTRALYQVFNISAHCDDDDVDHPHHHMVIISFL